WSSDVCSSDLGAVVRGLVELDRVGDGGLDCGEGDVLLALVREEAEGGGHAVLGGLDPGVLDGDGSGGLCGLGGGVARGRGAGTRAGPAGGGRQQVGGGESGQVEACASAHGSAFLRMRTLAGWCAPTR